MPYLENTVTISGALHKPGQKEFFPGEQYQDILPIIKQEFLLSSADKNNILLSRVDVEGKVKRKKLNIEELLQTEVHNQDVVYIPSIVNVLDRITIEAALFGGDITQSTDTTAAIPSTPLKTSISYQSGLTLRDILKRFGGLTPFADTSRAYIERDNERIYIPNVLRIWSEQDEDILLQPSDSIIIPIIPPNIAIAGQVNGPGRIPISKWTVCYELFNTCRRNHS